ncbi:hypothetical protein D3C85_1295860 [compost metagenome]
MRRLGAPQAFAVDAADHQALHAATQAVGHGESGQGAVGVIQRRQQTVYHGGVEEGASRVVDQDRRIVSDLQRGEAGAHRICARGAARDRPPA